MTYRELIEHIIYDSSQLDKDVTVYNISNDEYYPIEYTNITVDDDVLDKDHLFIGFRG